MVSKSDSARRDQHLQALMMVTGKSRSALTRQAVDDLLAQYRFPAWPHNFHMEHGRFEMWAYQPLSGAMVRMFGVLYPADEYASVERIQALVMLEDVLEVNLLTHMEMCNVPWKSFKIEKRDPRSR